jgi:hypothetical protein
MSDWCNPAFTPTLNLHPATTAEEMKARVSHMLKAHKYLRFTIECAYVGDNDEFIACLGFLPSTSRKRLSLLFSCGGPGVKIELQESLNDAMKIDLDCHACNRVGNIVRAIEMQLPIQAIILSKVSHDVACALATALKSDSNVKHLKLCGPPFCFLHQNTRSAFAELLAHNSSLKVLILDGVCITDAFVAGIGAALASNAVLLKLRLPNNQITCQGLSHLVMGLFHSPVSKTKLQYLDLSGNRFGYFHKEGLRILHSGPLLNVVQATCPDFTFDLQGSSILPTSGSYSESFSYLTALGCKIATSLTNSLDLSNIPFDGGKMSGLLGFMRELQKKDRLVSLVLNNCKLFNDGVTQLLEALPSSLRALDIGGNSFRFQAIRHSLSNFLVTARLQTLNLSENPRIDDHCLEALVLGLCASTSMLTLHIRACSVSIAGAGSFSRSLIKRNAGAPLQMLDLRFNGNNHELHNNTCLSKTQAGIAKLKRKHASMLQVLL